MQIPYFPGCTLTNKARGLNDTSKDCLKVLGLELKELENWYCCQANFSLLTDNLMNHLAPVRTLVSARKEADSLAVLCSTCYYVLKRVSFLMERDEAKRTTVFDFLEEEYKGPIRIVHLLELVRDRIGFAAVKEKVKNDLKNLAIAPYYGCQLLRPGKELAFDHPEKPVIFEEFLSALGVTVIDSPFKTECCGAFLSMSQQEAADDCVLKIVRSALKNGAEALTTSCPLCNFNLDWSQQRIAERDTALPKVPVLYLSEVMALALGVEVAKGVWEEHSIDPRPFLQEKGYLTRD